MTNSSSIVYVNCNPYYGVVNQGEMLVDSEDAIIECTANVTGGIHNYICGTLRFKNGNIKGYSNTWYNIGIKTSEGASKTYISGGNIETVGTISYSTGNSYGVGGGVSKTENGYSVQKQRYSPDENSYTEISGGNFDPNVKIAARNENGSTLDVGCDITCKSAEIISNASATANVHDCQITMETGNRIWNYKYK